MESSQDPQKTHARRYRDTRPPPAPAITTSPVVCLQENTFELNGRGDFGGWKTLDGKFGAALGVQAEGANSVLRLVQQQSVGHFGAQIRAETFDVEAFPLLAFDYCLDGVWFDMAITFVKGGTFGARFNDYGPFYDVIGAFQDVRADNAWHHAEINLKDVCAKAREKGVTDLRISELAFVNWNRERDGIRQNYGSHLSKGTACKIDNFRIFRPLSKGDVEFRWACEDDSGIAGYSFLLDENADTVPPPETPAVVTSKSFAGLADGRWYFHVRALDGAGNWGPANHAMVFVDGKAGLAAEGDDGDKKGETSVKKPLRFCFGRNSPDDVGITPEEENANKQHPDNCAPRVIYESRSVRDQTVMGSGAS